MVHPHSRAVLHALFVTFLWSTSWVLIKIGLDEIPALTFAGLRYVVAFVVLLPFLFSRSVRTGMGSLSRREWTFLAALGVVMYGVTQGTQFLALAYLPAQTTSLVLSFSPVLVAFAGIAFLRERPTPLQWQGVLVFLAGAFVFLYPARFPFEYAVGFAIAGVSLVSNAGAALLGRSVNRDVRLHPAAVTIVGMGVGAVPLLATGVAVQGLPALSAEGWLIVLWLAVVNTALAFTLWNASLRHLTAMESSVINNTMLIQIAVLAWVFLGETLDARQLAGLLLAAVGTLVVQLRTLPFRRMPRGPGAKRP